MRSIAILTSTLLSAGLVAQSNVTVSTGPTNSMQTFYSLANGEQGEAAIAEWDLAFEIVGFSSSILVNTAKGLIVYETLAAIADWNSIDTPDPDSWTLLHNSETDWSAGALTNGNDLDEPDGFNVGWGIYNIITHTIAGNKIYVIDDGQGYYRKLRINSLLSGTYSFTYADLDGGNEQVGNVNKTAFTGRNFAYWSMSTHSALDREPPTGAWDLLFTKYIGFVPTAYALAGVLQNKEIEVLQVDEVPTAEADPWSALYNMEINTIGADWKSFNMSTFEYEYVQDRTYFVKDHAGSIWKLIFIGYGGAVNGDMVFTQELVSATAINEVAERGRLNIHPNPVSNGTVNLVVDLSDPAAVLHVLDGSGRIVIQERLSGLDGMTLRTIDVSGLSSGHYTIRLQGRSSTAVTHLVIDR